MAGRFADLLPDMDQGHLRRACQQLPTLTDGALLAQLSFPPAISHLENVTRAPALLPLVISLAEHRAGGTACIPVSDLAVTADNGGMYVVSMSRRRVVEPVLASAVSRPAMPPLARLLAELPRARTAGLSPFAWGTARCLPFLPRVRYGRAILAPARWKLPAGTLPGPAAPVAGWVAAFDKLRDRLGLPGHVYAGMGDRRLRLDLDEGMDLAIMRAHLDATPDPALPEAPSPADHGWIDGRAHEIVIPVATTAAAARQPRVLQTEGELPVIESRQAVLPGSDVLYARLHAHPDVFDTILTSHLPRLLAAWEQRPRWWFVRYRDPGPHLRLRFRLADAEEYGPAASRLGGWAAALQQQGLACELSLDTYRPETARYGTGAALAAAEALFAADSAAALAELAVAAEPDAAALTAVSLADLAAAMTGSWATGMRWLIEQARQDRGPGSNRAVVRRAIALAGSGTDYQLAGLPAGQEVSTAWRARREAAAQYAGLLTPGNSHVQTDSVLWSLLHMHHNRVHGIRPGCEDRCRHAARAVALSWNARHPPAEASPA
jgi:thiopeptide-type bacteriocin biosynthesis protein